MTSLLRLVITITIIEFVVFFLQNYQSEEISTSLCQRWCESRHITFLRFNPLLGESIPVPEEASIKTLINVVIYTISHVASATGEGKDKIKAIKDQVV